MAGRCRKFVPNLFNKTKCQSCFGAKEAHSAEALESSKAARKISKCAYLFVSPDLDFSNPLQRTKRWQRRFFILYDDGELTYSVDDIPSTIPQGSVDMNVCTDVFDAEELTGHEFSIGVQTPASTLYIKGTSKDEIRRWFDVLVMYPRSLTIKTKRNTGSKGDTPCSSNEDLLNIDELDMGGPVARQMSYYPQTTDKSVSVSDDEDADSVHSKDSEYERSGRTRGRYKQRDVRRSKSEVRPSDLRLAEDEYNRKTAAASDGKPGLALSLPPSSTDIQTPKADAPVRKAGEPETFTSVRSMKHRKAKASSTVPIVRPEMTSSMIPAATQIPTPSPPALNTSTNSSIHVPDGILKNRRLSTPNISSNLTSHKPLSRAASAVTKVGAGLPVGGASGLTGYSYTPTATHPNEANETDEHKLAKSELHAKKSLEKSPIVRKGWLLIRDNSKNTWGKHWFVLHGTSLSYYKDAKAEETNEVDGVIDVGSAYEVGSVKAERNHGFKIKTKEGEYVLSAMTSGIRRNWIEALDSIIADLRRAVEKSARQDMGFVFESPIRSPRLPANSTPVAPPSLDPVVPDSNSRINTTLRSTNSTKPSRKREMAERRRETGDDQPLEELYSVKPSSSRSGSICSDTEREVSNLTMKQEMSLAAASVGATVTPNSNINHSTQDSDSQPPQSPKSPSSFVSPSQRIKEKSRAKTPPRARSPPPPSSVPVGASAALAGVSSDLTSILPTGASSDENDESMSAKLLESHKQVQHLQQQLQDVNSMVRKQRVEIESLQNKLELTTSQLHDMESALTHSAQNLNKERKNTSRLTEALERLKAEGPQSGDLQQKCTRLEKQLQDVTNKMTAQEVKIHMASSLDDELQVKTSKLATLEKVLANTRRHLQEAVETSKETELHYQAKIQEIEHDYEEELSELQDKNLKLEEKITQLVTQNSSSMDSDINSEIVREKLQAAQRLEELCKEQNGKLEQLRDENKAARQQIDDLQCHKDRIAVLQNQLELAQQECHGFKITSQSLKSDMESLKEQLDSREKELNSKCQENGNLLATIAQLQDRCHNLQEERGSSTVVSDWETERQELHEELESVTMELNSALESSQREITDLRNKTLLQSKELSENRATIQELRDKCKNLENELKSQDTSSVTSNGNQKLSSDDGFSLSQVTDIVGAVARCTERMTESAVAMIAGEMIETDIKVTINFNQDQRSALGNRTIEQMQKKFTGVRQRLNYMVRNSVDKKQWDKLKSEKDDLETALSNSDTKPQSKSSVQKSTSNSVESKLSAESSEKLTALLEKCRVDILCITTDLTKLDIKHTESKLKELNAALQQIDLAKSSHNYTTDNSVASFCDKLAVQAAAMFEMSRMVSNGLDMSDVLNSVENCLKSTSGSVTSIEDMSLRNFALLVSERLVITYELDRLVSTGTWKGVINQPVDFTTRTLVAETLQRLDIFSMAKGSATVEASLSTCLYSLLRRNNSERPSLDLLRSETGHLNEMIKETNSSLSEAVRSYCSEYVTELVNFGVLGLSDVDKMLLDMTNSICQKIKQLIASSRLSDMSSDWLFEHLVSCSDKVKGLGAKELPMGLCDVALRLSLLQGQYNFANSLTQRRQSSTLSHSLLAEASRLAGLSSDLAKKAAVSGSVESKIANLASRLEHTDRLLSAYTGHYTDKVQQVMREIVYSLQSVLLKHQYSSGNHFESPDDRQLLHEIEQLKLQCKNNKIQHEKPSGLEERLKTVEALQDEMSIMKAEHSKELDESRQDMKMVLKSVKAEEQRLAVELTEQIDQLKNQIADERRAHQLEMAKIKDSMTDHIPTAEHIQLKNKVRDLESCLHEMQEEFEEELYQERRAHLAELEKNRAELLDILHRVETRDINSDEVHSQYDTIIQKLKAEQASLQQWIDDIREAHRDEIDALQHEKETALSDEVTATQAALDAMQAAHKAELEIEKDKFAEYQEKAHHLVVVERDLLLQTRENDNKDKRITELEEKISNLTRSTAKLELSVKKSNEALTDLKSQNKRLSDRNAQIIDDFSQELEKLRHDASKTCKEGVYLSLKAQVDSLNDRLKLEQMDKQQAEDKFELMISGYEQKIKQLEEEKKMNETKPDTSASSSPAEEMLYRRRLRAKSPSSSARNSSPPVLALDSQTSNQETLTSTSPTAASPRKLVDRAFDLSRSRSTPVMDGIKPRNKRLSNIDMPDNSTDHEKGQGRDRYMTGGLSLADRMKRFT